VNTRIATFLLGAATIVWFAGPALAQATYPPQSAALTAPTAPAANPIQSIQQAPDPSAAVSAFASAVSSGVPTIQAQEAYVSKMVDFGMPELAIHQAQALTRAEPTNGTAWGVLAYVNAKQNRMAEALSDLVQAAQHSPGDVFVQRTAGELFAWYDLNFDKVKLPDAMKVALDQVHKQLGEQKAFTEAYQQAKDALAQMAQAGEQQNTPALPPPVPSGEAYAVPPVGDYYPTGYFDGSYAYSNPWLTCQPAYYSDWWWQPNGFFWGASFFPSFAFFDRDDFHHGHWHNGSNWAGHNGANAAARINGRNAGNASAAVSSAANTGLNKALTTGGTPGRNTSAISTAGRAGNSAVTPAAPLFNSGRTVGSWHPSAGVAGNSTWSGSTGFSGGVRTFSAPTMRSAPSFSGARTFSAPTMRAAPSFSGGGFRGGGFSGGAHFSGGGGGSFHGGGGGGHGGGHR
jgi:hypothetical protein